MGKLDVLPGLKAEVLRRGLIKLTWRLVPPGRGFGIRRSNSPYKKIRENESMFP